MTGLVHTQHPVLGVGAGSLGLPDTQVFLDYDRAHGHVPALLFPPRGGVHQVLLQQPLGPSGSSHDRVLCFHRAAPSYFFSVAALPLELSISLPEVHFQKQVRTWGEGSVVWPWDSAAVEGDGGSLDTSDSPISLPSSMVPYDTCFFQYELSLIHI